MTYEKCLSCWHFIELNDTGDSVVFAPFIHLDNGEKEHDHDATSSGDFRTLDQWKSDHPELFVMYADGEIGPNSALFTP